MNPIRYDPDGCPLFSNLDIDNYGLPELYGYEFYRVVESRDPVFVTDWKMEQERDFRQIHRYSRLARFKSTLYTILGERGNIPDHILTICRTYMKTDSWDECRKILKHFNQRKYYDSIPLILKTLGMKRLYNQLTDSQLTAIIQDFMKLSNLFETHKHTFKRRYFPNIRFIIFKLLELHNHTPNYQVKFIRTDRKQKSLNALWDTLINNSKIWRRPHWGVNCVGVISNEDQSSRNRAEDDRW
jgi:hypothetical protein